MSVKVVLKKEKINKAGEAPVYLRFIKNRKPQYVSLDLRVKPEDWDEDACEVKRSHPNRKRTNAYLATRKAEAMDIYLKLEAEPSSPAPGQLKKALLGQASESFLKYFEQDLVALEKRGKINTTKKAQSVYNKLKEFLGGRDLLFDELTVSFLNRYKNHLRYDLGNGVNTIHGDLKIFRKLVKAAVREDLVPYDRDPFLKFKLETEKTSRAYLLEDELNAIWELPLAVGTKMWHYRNMFVFAADTGGPRISDLLQLKWENFSGTHINFITQKTGQELSLKVPTRSLGILNLYRSDKSLPTSFVFPLLKERDYSDPAVLQAAIASANAYGNTNLKIICEKVGIKKNVSFHVSRHTFATRGVTKGVSLEAISKILGHASVKTTQIYAKVINEKMDQAMDAFN